MVGLVLVLGQLRQWNSIPNEVGSTVVVLRRPIPSLNLFQDLATLHLHHKVDLSVAVTPYASKLVHPIFLVPSMATGPTGAVFQPAVLPVVSVCEVR